MTADQLLRESLASLEVNETFTEAAVGMRDGSRLCFCHRVGECWVKAVAPHDADENTGLAGQVLAGIAKFRLNAKHLDVTFQDGSRWEAAF